MRISKSEASKPGVEAIKLQELHEARKRRRLLMAMLAIQIETIIGILVVLNLVGLTIAAYRIMKRK